MVITFIASQHSSWKDQEKSVLISQNRVCDDKNHTDTPLHMDLSLEFFIISMLLS
jgi:hypothetical protein